MAKDSTSKEDLVGFSRNIVMLLNRATMYHRSHPYIIRSIDDSYSAIQQVFNNITSLALILHRDQFFIDENSVDPRLNVQRIASYFKKAGIQSISFEKDLDKAEMKAFLDIFTSREMYPTATEMKKAMVIKGIRHLKINHVLFKKVTQDDEVVSHDVLEKLTPDISDGDQRTSKKLFADLVIEKLLTEEFEEMITLENLLKDPAALSRKMTEAERGSTDSGENEAARSGRVLLRRLDILGNEVEKRLVSDEETDFHEVATALLEMKKRLLEGMEAQRSLNIGYSNEEIILDKANQITDAVIYRLIKDEYGGGKTSIERLAQILRRLVLEPTEMKRLLPGIRAVLMKEGMSLGEYLRLVEELTKELQSDELVRILQQSSEEIGIDGQLLIEQARSNPVQAAELLFLASEIQKSSGDERVLTDLLVDYVERLGSRAATDAAGNTRAETEQHFRKIITAIESRIVGQLKKNVVGDDLLERLEQRFNKRIDEVLEKLKFDWIQSHSSRGKIEASRELTVLQLLEQSAGEGDELGEILAVVRAKVQAKEINENDFGSIYAEIMKQQHNRDQKTENDMPRGVLKSTTLTLFIEKEIARAKRYRTPFSILSFSLVRAIRKNDTSSAKISYSACIASILKTMSSTVRDADILGQLGKGRFALILPMTNEKQAQFALRRCMKILHGHTIKVCGTLLEIRVAGVATTYDPISTPDVNTFLDALINDLTRMEKRIKNILTYF